MADPNASASYTYDSVDLTKNRSHPVNDSGSAMPLYNVLDRSVRPKAVQEKREEFQAESEYSMVTAENMYSTDTQKNSSPRNEAKAIPSNIIVDKPKSKLVVISRMKFACILVAIAVVAIITLVCLAVVFAEVANLKRQTGSVKQSPATQVESQLQQSILDQNAIIQQLNITLESTLYTYETLTNKLNTSITALSHRLMNQIMSETGTIRDDLERLSQNFGSVGQNALYPASSCAAIPLSSPSGYYWVRASNGSAVSVYCDTSPRPCGGVIAGGWMRVAKLNFTTNSCPSNLTQRTVSGIRTCARGEDPGGCSQIRYSTANIHYSRVCGRIKAHEVGNPDAFGDHSEIRPPSPDIDDNYVDGVSLTHGDPREHIWTFAAGRSQPSASPSFVGDDYFCGTGILWDGCSDSNACCSLINTPPWFYKQLPQPGPTSDDIEMRVCRDEPVTNEDIAIEIIELYVQ